MKNVSIIRQNLDEKQFTQLALNDKRNYTLSVYFRFTNVFRTLTYKYYIDAIEMYDKLIK